MSDTPPSISPLQAGAVRTRSLADSPALAQLAVQLLRTSTMLGDMSDEDLQCAVGYLRLATFAAGATVLRQGDATNTGYLLLILTGDVSVEAVPLTHGEPVDISVLGAGNVIGELGLIDGSPRSASCIAVSAVNVAVLSRKAFDLMLHEHPTVAAMLMVALAKRIADRLRAMSDQLGMYAQIAGDAQRDLKRAGGAKAA